MARPWGLFWLKRKDVFAIAIGFCVGRVAVDGFPWWLFLVFAALGLLAGIIDGRAGLPTEWREENDD